MQKRHLDRAMYFREQENTSRDYYVSFVKHWHGIYPGTRVLEIGCGEGGNLIPFARLGCSVTGIDMVGFRIEEAREFFSERDCEGTFLCADFMKADAPSDDARRYDIVLLHDVIEHVPDKQAFLSHIMKFMRPSAVLFVGFPAWQMPFGGHQQICRSRLCSHLPFFHLLPAPLYKAVLRGCGESGGAVDELLEIKRCGVSVEQFERVAVRCGYRILGRTLWMVNPHYRQKFGLTPRKVGHLLARIPYLRNYISTSCWYCIKKGC